VCIAGACPPSDRGSQYVSIKYAERLAQAGIGPSIGSVGDFYGNALAETINGIYKAKVIHRRGPWRSFEAVEFATLEWVDWFNNVGSWSLSETASQPKLSNATTPCWTGQPWRPNFDQVVSGKSGAVHMGSSFEHATSALRRHLTTSTGGGIHPISSQRLRWCL
jgi:hypothetical protein